MHPDLLKAAREGNTGTFNKLFPKAQDQAVVDVDVPDGHADQNISISAELTPGGNTVLHIAATHGHLNLANLIYAEASSLLEIPNAGGETLLHCAARAGHHQIVTSFTEKVEEVRVLEMLRARNSDGETALHLAARNGHVQVAKHLITADRGLANIVDNDGSAGRELANIVDDDGISPLYLAAMIGSLPLLQVILPSSSTETASYAGPRGQTALHAAALCQNSEIAEKLLEWKPMLAEIVDKSGSTPLHYAASAGNAKLVELLLLKDISWAYKADSSGLFPVHVASIRGEVSVIKKLINQCPDSDELLDFTGRNLLHTAVEHKNGAIVQHVCKRSEFVKLMNARDHEEWLVKLMNARDYEGNTPLHLAVRTGDEFIVSLLVQNKRVNPSIMNKRGLTPLDLSFIEFEESGLSYFMKPSYWILWCLAWLGAIESPGRMDHFLREKITPVDLKKESEKLAQLNRGLAIVSVVIATVTFAAAFTLPGGFKADGTPTQANRYMFKAFVIADTFAFIFSTYSTYLTTFGGSNLVPLKLQRLYFVYSSVLLLMASKSLVAALAFGIYLVLAPVSHFTGIFVCVITSTSVLFLGTPDTIRLLNLAKTMTRRLGWKGLFKTCVPKYVKNWWKSNYLEVIFQTTLGGSLIYLFIFLLALPGKNKIMG